MINSLIAAVTYASTIVGEGLIAGFVYTLAFFVGSIPAGYWVANWAGIPDIRNYGSGNIGATNVSRLLGLPYFGLVLFLDAGKAFLFCLFLQKLLVLSDFPTYWIFFPIFGLLMGNIRSIFLQGRGGKGVATAVGVLLAFVPSLALIFALLWLFFLSLFRSAGLASILAIWGLVLIEICYPCAVLPANAFSTVLGCMAMLITYSHRNNIEQLCKQWGIT